MTFLVKSIFVLTFFLELANEPEPWSWKVLSWNEIGKNKIGSSGRKLKVQLTLILDDRITLNA